MAPIVAEDRDGASAIQQGSSSLLQTAFMLRCTELIVCSFFHREQKQRFKLNYRDDHRLDETHHQLRDLMRRFVDEKIKPNLNDWEENEYFPSSVYLSAAQQDILGIGFDPEYGGVPSDIFHSLIITEELCMSGSQGIAAGLGSHTIALKPIQGFGSHMQKKAFIEPVLKGYLVAALAITEPDTGSDVASIRTTATETNDHFLVNGSKMFITSGTRANLLITAVRTGGPGHDGISLLVIDNQWPGVEISRSLKKMGWRCSDTAEISFRNVKVPKSNLIGEEGAAFKIIMENFQEERLSLAAMAYASAQAAYDEALAYAKVRETFGRPLISRQVIRHKFARMLSRIEVAREYVYSVADRMKRGEQCSMHVSIAKNMAVDACDEVAYEAVQIMGGMGFMRGTVSERVYRDSKVLSIGGGTTEIMNEIICKSAGIG